MKLARDPKQIGNIVRTVRNRKGWSQEELGARAGLRQKNISTIETGYASTKLHTLLTVLAVLDLELRIGERSTGDWELK